MAGTVEGTVYCLSLRLSVGEDAIVSFARTPTAAPAPAREHPVEIDMAADPLAIPHNHLDRQGP